MKSTKYFLFVMVFLFLKYANATVHTFNNNNPSPGQYTFWSTLESNCNSGDTVYVSGSATSYGDITVTVNNLTIIGTGYHPRKQNPLVSTFNKIYFDVPSINIFGIKAELIIQNYNSSSAVDVIIEHCLTGIKMNSTAFDAQYKLRYNVLQHPSNSPFAIDGDFTVNANADLMGTIRNNIIYGSIDLNGGSIGYCSIENNVFIEGGNGNLFNLPIHHSYFDNNILINYSQFIYLNTAVTNTTCNNNCIYPGTVSFNSIPGDNGTTITGNPLFVNGCLSNCYYTYGADYRLQPSSPCVNAGTNNTDIGAYGLNGVYFDPTGEPLIPQIREMNAPAAGVGGQGFNITITSTTK